MINKANTEHAHTAHAYVERQYRSVRDGYGQWVSRSCAASYAGYALGRPAGLLNPGVAH